MLKLILFFIILLNCYGGDTMVDYKRIIQRTTNSERITSGKAEIETNELIIIEDLDALAYKNRNNEIIFVSKNNYIIDDINELKNTNKKYKIGDIIELRGLNSNNDKLYHKRQIETEDDGSGIELKNGTWANLIKNSFNKKNVTKYPKTKPKYSYPETVVITGDSLSYNHQDYDSTPRQSAVDCWEGMNSWSFLLRDIFLTNDKNFKFANEVEKKLVNSKIARVTETLKYIAPFGGNIQYIQVDTNSEICFYFKKNSDFSYLYMWYLESLTGAVEFDVYSNDVFQAKINTQNTDGTHNGSPLKFLEVSAKDNWNKITLKNFSKAGTFSFCGIGQTFTKFILNGKGGHSSKWLIDNISEVVTSNNPDLVITIIGANDPWSGAGGGSQTVSQYKDNLRRYIDIIRESNPYVDFLFLSPPLTDESIIPNRTMQKYINAMYQISLEKTVDFIDLKILFEAFNPLDYRFDSIHFNKNGNNILLGKVVDKIFRKNESKLSLDTTNVLSGSINDGGIKKYTGEKYGFSTRIKWISDTGWAQSETTTDKPLEISLDNTLPIIDYSLIKIKSTLDWDCLKKIEILHVNKKVFLYDIDYSNGEILIRMFKLNGEKIDAQYIVDNLSSFDFVVRSI